jgi:hypothetical protein
MLQKYLAQAAVFGAALLIAAILIVVAVGFCGAALYFALREALTPAMAALATGLTGLVLALVIVLIGRLAGCMIAKSKRRQQAARPAGARGLAADLGLIAGEELAALARSHTHATLAASLVAGIAVGASPGLRRLLRDLLEI